MELTETEIAKIIEAAMEVVIHSPQPEDWNYPKAAKEAAHAIAEGWREGVVFEETATGKFISTPSLACNFLRLGGGLFDGVKIPVDAATGTMLDGQLVTITVSKREEKDADKGKC